MHPHLRQQLDAARRRDLITTAAEQRLARKLTRLTRAVNRTQHAELRARRAEGRLRQAISLTPQARLDP
jgi:hypothetical protein